MMLDLVALDVMPQVSFVTGTSWTDGDVHFSSVPLAALLGRMSVEAEAGTIKLVALNGYRIEIPIEEIGDNAPIVATRIDGETEPECEMGPFRWPIPTILALLPGRSDLRTQHLAAGAPRSLIGLTGGLVDSSVLLGRP